MARAVLLIAALAWLLVTVPLRLQAAPSSGADRPTVLVLIPMQPGRPLFDMFARGIMNELLGGPPVAVSIEYLFDVLDPPAINAQQLRFLRAKYARQRVDVVIAIGHPRYARVREELGLSPHVPIVFLEAAPAIPPVPGSTRLQVRDSVATSYEFVRSLRPGPHHVALLGGDSSADRIGNRATLVRLAELVPPSRLIDLTGLTLGQMRERVRTLPDDTYLLVGDVLSDRTGRPLSYRTLMSELAPVARVPIVVANDMLLGEGALGGRIYELQPLGARLAQVARRVLSGTPVDRIPSARVEPVAVLDARQLRRLGIPESRVPAGTALRFREPSVWEEYGPWLRLGAALLVVQGALIAWLTAERRRRRSAQHRLAARLRLQALVAEISTAFANVSADKVEDQMVSSLERVGRVLEAEDCAIWTWRDPDDAPRLVCRWVTRPGAAPITSVVDDAMLSWARPRLDLGQEVLVGDVVEAVLPANGLGDQAPPSLLLLPLRVDARVVGAFSLRHAPSQPWTPQMIDDLRTIGEIIASAVVRKRTDASIRTQLETLAQVNRLAGLGELATTLAHELNQPLAAILANTEVAVQLLDMPAPPLEELRAIVADVIADDERAGSIIRNMRTMLRKHPVDAGVVDVNLIVTDVVTLVRHDPRLRGNRVDLALGDDVPMVKVDATQLKQVLLNLVVNAVDAMASVGLRLPVHVRTTRRDSGAVIEVRDQGPGIAPDVLGRLFDPFFTTKPDGLGVGLAISRSILEAAGGRVTADNCETGGAVFRVWLPEAPADPPDAVSAGSAAP